MTSLDELIPEAEQRQIMLRAVFLDAVRVAATCDCRGCQWTADQAISLAVTVGASRAEIRHAWETGRREA